MNHETMPEFRRRMARFELRKARRLVAEGRPDRAAAALKRARLWRWDPLLRNDQKGGAAAASGC